MPLMPRCGALLLVATLFGAPLVARAQSSGFVVAPADDEPFEETPRAPPGRKLPPVARPLPKAPEPDDDDAAGDEDEEEAAPAPVRDRPRGRGMEIIVEPTAAPTTIRVGDSPGTRPRASPEPKSGKVKSEPAGRSRGLPLPPPPPPPPAYRDDEAEREPYYVPPEPRRDTGRSAPETISVPSTRRSADDDYGVESSPRSRSTRRTGDDPFVESGRNQRQPDPAPEPRRPPPPEEPATYAPRGVLPQGKRVGDASGVAIEEVDLGAASSSFIKAGATRTPEKPAPKPKAMIPPPPPPPPPPAPPPPPPRSPDREEYLLPPAPPAAVREPEVPAPAPTPSRRPVRTVPVEAPPPAPRPVDPAPAAPANPVLGEDPFEKFNRELKEIEGKSAPSAPTGAAAPDSAPTPPAPQPSPPSEPEKPSRTKRTKERVVKERESSERPEKTAASRKSTTPIADPVLLSSSAPRTGVSAGATVGLLLARAPEGGFVPAVAYGLAAAVRPVATSPFSFDLFAVRAARTEGTELVSVSSAWIHVAVHAVVSKQWSNGLFLGAGVGPLITGNSATYSINDGKPSAPVGSQIRFGGDATALFGVRVAMFEVRADLHALIRGGPRLDLLPTLSLSWRR